MKTINLLLPITFFLGIVSLLSVFFMNLALTDIYNNHEPDLTNEWGMVRIGFLIIFSFIIMALITIFKLYGKLNEKSEKLDN